MKGSAITGPVGKEAAELWPVSHTSILDAPDDLQRLTYLRSVLPQTLVSSCEVLIKRFWEMGSLCIFTEQAL